MNKDKIYKGHGVPDYVEKFGVAIAHFALRVRETKSIKHNGQKGSEREISIRTFIKELLPSIYEVDNGEVIDLLGNKSPQLDIIIYDRSKNFPFYKGEYTVLPAEALLCSIEVKSTMNAAEAVRCVNSAKSLKLLKPNTKAVVDNVGDDRTQMRFFHGVFAYSTDISQDGWAEKELNRFCDVGPPAVDFIYVLGRGLINTRSKTFIPEDEATGQALVAFHFSILSFIDRENSRRPSAPYISYATNLNKFWKKI